VGGGGGGVSLGWGGKTSDILGIPSLSSFPKIESFYGQHLFMQVYVTHSHSFSK
jgi:hypothetical protein